MPFDPSAFIQDPSVPLQWATLNQRSHENTMKTIDDIGTRREQTRQFDVGADQSQQQIDETQRSHYADEYHNELVRKQQIAEFEEKKRNEQQRKVEAYHKDLAVFEEHAEDGEEVNAANAALLEKYGLVMTPEREPAPDTSGARPPPGMDTLPGSTGGSAPAPLGQTDAAYEGALSTLPDASPDLGRDLIGDPMTPLNSSADPDASTAEFHQAVAADGTNLGHAPVPKIPAKPMTDADFKTLEQNLAKPPVDLGENVRAHAGTRAKERYDDAAAQITALNLTDKVVEGAALNMLADALGQPPVAPMLPAPHPLEPIEAQVTPEGKIPEKILAIINDAREDPSDISTGLADTGGKYALTDMATGQVVSRGDLFEKQKASQYNRRKAYGMQTIADLDPNDPARKVLESYVEAYAMARTEEEAKGPLAVLSARVGDAARLANAKIMSAQREQSGERADEGRELQIISQVNAREETLLKGIVGASDYKALAKNLRTVKQDLGTLLKGANPEQQRMIRRRVATAIEPRLTDADAREYQESGLKARMDELKNTLLGEGELSPEFLKTMQQTIAENEAFMTARIGAFVDTVDSAIRNDPGLRDVLRLRGWSEQKIDKHLRNRAETANARLVDGYKARLVPEDDGPAPASYTKEQLEAAGIEPD